MPPRRQVPDDQQEELRTTLETFTANLQETLVQAVEVALTTVLQRQQNAHEQQPQGHAHNHQQHEDSSDEDLAETLFANPRHLRNQVNVAAHAEHQLNRWENQPDDRRSDSGFWVEIPEFSGNLSTEEFLDWLSSVEEILEYKRIPED